MRIRVDPRKVQHVEMRDGTRYPVGRNGTVSIDHPKHEAEMRSHGAPDAGETGWVGERIGSLSAPGRECACGFNAYAWTKTCPRCGADLC